MSPGVRQRLREAVLTVGAVLGSACLLLALAGAVLDVRPLVFRSGSMAPAIPTGSFALAHTEDAGGLDVGDVVSVVDDGGSRVSHRVVATEPRGEAVALTLRGDANPVDDSHPYVVEEADRVVASVPWLGYLVAWLAGPSGLLLLGAYAAFLGSVLLRRGSRDGGGGRPAGRRRGVRRRSVARGRGASAPVVTVLGVALVVVPHSDPAWAAWSDTGRATSGSFVARTVPKPAAVGCTVDNPVVGTKSMTTTWTAENGVTYTAVVRETGTSLTVTGTGATRSATVTGGLLGALLGTSFTIDVTATLTGTSWTARSSRAGTFVLLGLGFTCGSWT